MSAVESNYYTKHFLFLKLISTKGDGKLKYSEKTINSGHWWGRYRQFDNKSRTGIAIVSNST